jgi:hypothetical protein
MCWSTPVVSFKWSVQTFSCRALVTDCTLQIINFLSNSIKFTKFEKERRITIKLAASGTKPTEKDFGIAFLSPRKDLAKDTSMPATPTTPAPEYGLGDEVYIYIGVEDTGRGLTEDECKVLFQRFAQGKFSLAVHIESSKLMREQHLPRHIRPMAVQVRTDLLRVSFFVLTFSRLRIVYQSRSLRITGRSDRSQEYSRSWLDICFLHQDQKGRST